MSHKICNDDFFSEKYNHAVCYKKISTTINFPQFVFGKNIFANIFCNFFWTIFAIFFAKFIYAQNICVLNFVLQNCIFCKFFRKNQFTNLYFTNFLEVYYQRMFFCKNLTSFENNFLKKIVKNFGWKKTQKYMNPTTQFFFIKSNLQIGIL